ncbi:Kic1p [Rhizophagus irregularis DAOM 197198w]|uniref:Kic1p n=1 Tax=Rhizophagus irregularis (strain DAOM 197198w) TaxID=1432141 RepID=A0A015N954_RHIIW|nr:Kic1p [Rhizophagus irregularis DAOM 197198w]
MLVMDYAKGGNLNNYLQKHFINITWTEKIKILVGISYGLQVIHRNNFIHRDIHSGNILLSQHWQIGELGLSQPADNTLSNNEIYRVIPYIAPEIFKGAAFSKESDIYSFGIVMWELTTGCKPFINVEHDVNLIYEIIDGKPRDTPECYANLMKKCWDSDPLKRPTIDEVWDFAIKWCQLVDEWIYSGIPLNDPKDSADLDETIKQAEKKRLELIRSEKLGPKYTEKSHPKAVFTSSALSSFISSSRISFNLKQEYITKEYELDINDIQSSSTQNINSDTQNSFNSQHQNVHISRPLRPLSKLITTVTANSSSKRNIKELNIETPNNSK